MVIYEPGEDSYLMQKYVEEYSEVNSVLDMGTGTGIQAITAAKKAKKILAVDINPDAVKTARISGQIEKIKNIEFIESNLFEKVTGKFDLIIFNPPYLPEEKNVKDIALVSGKRGCDTTIKFLDALGPFLNADGKILLTSSSLASQSLISEAIARNLFESKILEKIHVFFEDIILYELRKSEKLKRLEDIGMKNPILFAKGKRGVIIKGRFNKKTVAVKMKKPGSDALGTIRNEANFLEILNKEDIGPKLIMHEKDFLMYVFVEGIFIEEFLEKAFKKDILDVLEKTFDQLFRMDTMQINKFEMHHPHKHILIDKTNPVLIDFERARYTESPKNVTQFCDYLSGMRVSGLLEKKGIKIEASGIKELAKEYKKGFKKKNYKKIISIFSSP
ncbi:methyltransferase [Candidatus Woesearchaeota archaeon]|nr:methyltransferase [Candidatus Woesearchaeota archaeon]